MAGSSPGPAPSVRPAATSNACQSSSPPGYSAASSTSSPPPGGRGDRERVLEPLRHPGGRRRRAVARLVPRAVARAGRRSPSARRPRARPGAAGSPEASARVELEAVRDAPGHQRQVRGAGVVVAGVRGQREGALARERRRASRPTRPRARACAGTSARPRRRAGGRAADRRRPAAARARPAPRAGPRRGRAPAAPPRGGEARQRRALQPHPRLHRRARVLGAELARLPLPREQPQRVVDSAPAARCPCRRAACTAPAASRT